MVFHRRSGISCGGGMAMLSRAALPHIFWMRVMSSLMV